jgi:hypothetical protein
MEDLKKFQGENLKVCLYPKKAFNHEGHEEHERNRSIHNQAIGSAHLGEHA